MQVVVFDLDTALCQTSTMDGMAMASAIKDVADCQIAPESVKSLQDWKSIWYGAVRRVATKQELSELRARFTIHLRRQFLIRPAVVQGNYVLIQHVNRLQAQKDAVACIVSNSTRSVVDIKSRAVGLLAGHLPVVTGEDAESTEAMLALLQTRVKRFYGESLDGSDLVASDYWFKAASLLDMNHFLPEVYERALSDCCQQQVSSSASFSLFH